MGWISLCYNAHIERCIFEKYVLLDVFNFLAGDPQSNSPSPDVSPMSKCWVRQLASPPTTADFGVGVVYVNTQGVTGTGGGGIVHAIDVWSGRDLWEFDGKDNSVGKFIIVVYCNMKHLYCESSRPAIIVQSLDS